MVRLSTAFLLAFAAIVGCVSTSGRNASTFAPADTHSDQMKRRADSLIARLLDTPGTFWSDGHIYVFSTDEELLEDLASLELHAVPALFQCMGDDRPSRVTYTARRTGRARRALRGAVCFQALVNTSFFQMRIDSLLERVTAESGCDETNSDDVSCDGFADYEAGGRELRQQLRIWRAYLDEFRSGNYAAPPLLRHTSVGCYELRLATRGTNANWIDTTRRVSIKLDTLPLPGSVRPDTLWLTPTWFLTGRARWSAHYNNRVVVSWQGQDSLTALHFNFGGSDSALAAYDLRRLGHAGSGGRVDVRRSPCAT